MDGDHRLDLLLLPFLLSREEKEVGDRGQSPQKVRPDVGTSVDNLNPQLTDYSLGLIDVGAHPFSVTRTKVRESRGSHFVAGEGRSVVGEIRNLMHDVQNASYDQNLITIGCLLLM